MLIPGVQEELENQSVNCTFMQKGQAHMLFLKQKKPTYNIN